MERGRGRREGRRSEEEWVSTSASRGRLGLVLRDKVFLGLSVFLLALGII